MPDHFRVPFTLDPTGSYEVVGQDTVAEISQCVAAVLQTPIGTRVEQIDYGIPDLTFSNDSHAVADIVQAVGRWEPRAIGVQVAVTTDGAGTAQIIAKIPDLGVSP